MTRMTLLALGLAAAGLAATPRANAADGDVLAPISQRFAAEKVDEVPHFQRHVVPLMGKLGCNGRACHGSFQGQGGFRLSLFGYDFKMDHEGLTKGDEPRVDLEFPAESLALEKPTLAIPHRGGKRMDVGSWEYRVFLKWIESGAKPLEDEAPTFVRLEVTPSEMVFAKQNETAQMRAIAVWSDGSREDVTPLCRFQSNDEQVAGIDQEGLVTGNEPGDTHVVVFYDKAVVPVPVIRPVSDKVGPKYPKTPTPTRIDELVVEKLRKVGIVQSDLASDADFLRRVSLDMTGTLPSPQEVEQFLSDTTPDKRARKIDELLERPAYAAWWTTLLNDFTGNNSDALNNVGGQRGVANQEWYDWIHKRVAANVPYDELVAGILLAVSRNKGEDFAEYCESMSKLYTKDSDSQFADRDFMPYYWARRTIRQPEEKALSVAYSFMGIRIQCAQCHKHPFDQWTQDDYNQFTNFFRGVNYGTNPEARDEYDAMMEKVGLKGKNGGEARRALADLLKEGKVIPLQEVYAVKPRKNEPNRNNRNRNQRGNGNQPAKAKLLGGDVVELAKYDDARQPVMDWLRSKDNPYFARAFVNRVWAQYFNVGIVEPPDDLSLANPPSNRALLDYLAEGFINSGFDMKWVHREIANSRTYQLSWQPNETNRLDEKNFSRAVPRRLPAEVAYDALVYATASDGEIEKMNAELRNRAIAMAGYGARTNARNNSNYALTIFGKSTRESNCDCERSMEPSLLQTVYLRNDNDVFTTIDRRGGWLNDITRAAGNRARSEPKEPEKPTLREEDRRAISRLEGRLKELREKGNKKQVERFQKELATLRREAEKRAEKKPDDRPAAAPQVASLDSDELIRQAYLRTLSRYPTDEELARSKEFVDGSADKADGIRGLLWALLNTKEFIVNH